MFFFKKKEEISRTTPGYEESERKTPLTGKILLLFMFAAGVIFGWLALDDLARLITEPPPLSSCAYNYESGFFTGSEFRLSGIYSPRRYLGVYSEPYRYGYNSPVEGCDFSKLEKDYNIPVLYEPRKPLEKERNDLQLNLNSITSQLYNVRDSLRSSTGEYSVGLEEKQAGVSQPLFPTGQSGQNIVSLREQEQDLLRQKSELDGKIAALDAKIKEVDDKLREAYKSVFEEQNRRLRWYEFKIFLIQLLFTLPLFWLVFAAYLRLHRKNSPYTVIFTAMVAVGSILLLRVILFWFWGLFLARVLEVLIEWFAKYEIIRTLLFYFGMLLSFLVFGGAVYWLQKKIFDPRRVTIRRFRAKQCPHCQTNLDLSVFYCPNCGSQLKSKCEKCGQARFVGLPNCPYCGDRGAV